MQYYAINGDLSSQKSDCLVVGIYQDQKLSASAKKLPADCRAHISELLKQGDFSGKLGTCLLSYQPIGIAAKRLLLIGLGAPATKLTADNFETLICKLADQLKTLSLTHCHLALEEVKVADYTLEQQLNLLVLTIERNFYEFNAYKKTDLKPSKAKLAKITLTLSAAHQLAIAKKALPESSYIAQAAIDTIELAHQPSNVCTPTYLANVAKQIAKESSKVSIKILDRRDLEKEKMHALLAVAQGSHQPPKMIVLNYQGGKKSTPPIVLVGKGVTFDSGGISLKPGLNMQAMKMDMCGAATVINLLRLVDELALPLNIIGIAACVENMPDGNAYRPGDILTSAAGHTIEITNTDAEGRLILCDALHYARKFNPSVLIDIATLTGACIIALGHHYTGLYSKDQALADQLLAAGIESNDLAWRMPLHDSYAELLKSQFADCVNASTAGIAGSITAATFLAKFTEGLTWAHLDIAGSAFTNSKGATGRPIALLAQYLMNLAMKK